MAFLRRFALVTAMSISVGWAASCAPGSADAGDGDGDGAAADGAARDGAAPDGEARDGRERDDAQAAAGDGATGDGAAAGDGGAAASDASTGDGALPCQDDLQSDPENCGTCGKSCSGATCTTGFCDPRLVLDAQEAPSGPTVNELSCFVDQGRGRIIALPVELERGGLRRIVQPVLTNLEQTALENALNGA